MRVIDQETWPRREHFRIYSGLEFAHVNICVQVDVTELWANRARAGAPPTLALVYVVTRAANRVPELRSVSTASRLWSTRWCIPRSRSWGTMNCSGW